MYRENHGHEENASLACEVTVRFRTATITRTIVTTALDPMAVVQHQVSDELGVPLHEVVPITWHATKGANRER